jgi:uncharacterized membrane protein
MINIVAIVGLIIGLFIVHKADGMEKSHEKLLYALVGVIAVIWSLFYVFKPQDARISSWPLIFSFFSLGTIYTKGVARSVAALIVVFIFLVVFL